MRCPRIPPVDPFSRVPLELEFFSECFLTLWPTPLQHHVLAARGIPSTPRQGSPHVCLRPNRLRLRTHWQLPHLHRRRPAATVLPPVRLQGALRHEYY